MVKFADLGDVQQIEVEGKWSRQPLLGRLDSSRQIVSEYLWADANLWFCHAEDRMMLTPASAAVVWQMFSTRGRQDNNRELMPAELKKLGDVLKERANKDEFSLISARLILISGRLALQVVGRHTESKSEHNCLLLPKRKVQGWYVQELGFRFPSDWYSRSRLPRFAGYMKVISGAWQSIVWSNDIPPLYVPSKSQVLASASLQFRGLP